MGKGQAKKSNRGQVRSVGLGDQECEWRLMVWCRCALVLMATETTYGVCSTPQALSLLLFPYFHLFSCKAMGYLLAFLPTSGEEGPDLWWLSVTQEALKTCPSGTVEEASWVRIYCFILRSDIDHRTTAHETLGGVEYLLSFSQIPWLI